MSASLKYVSIDEKIIAFFHKNSNLMFEALVRSERAKPVSANLLMNRMDLPKYLNQTIKDHFSSLCEHIRFLEEKGHPWDWVLYGAKISVKQNSSSEIFPRPYKNGYGMTEGNPIQLFNPHGQDIETIDFTNLFDYLLVINAYENQFGLYLYSSKWVSENYHNQNGHQVRLRLGPKENCLAYFEPTPEMMKTFNEKYQKQTENDIRGKEKMFEEDNIRRISNQINYTNGQ